MSKSFYKQVYQLNLRSAITVTALVPPGLRCGAVPASGRQRAMPKAPPAQDPCPPSAPPSAPRLGPGGGPGEGRGGEATPVGRARAAGRAGSSPGSSPLKSRTWRCVPAGAQTWLRPERKKVHNVFLVRGSQAGAWGFAFGAAL